MKYFTQKYCPSSMCLMGNIVVDNMAINGHKMMPAK